MRPEFLLKQIKRCSAFHRGKDALAFVIAKETNPGDRIAVPVFTCNTSVPSTIRAMGRNIEWIDITADPLGVNMDDLRAKLSGCQALVVHSYWGHPIGHIADIIQLAREHNIALIEDRAHLLKLDDLDDTRDARHYLLFSLSKEMPYLLGGLLFPKESADFPLDYSLMRNLRELVAFCLIYANRRPAVKFCEKMLGALVQRRQRNPDPVIPAMQPRKGFSLLQWLFLPIFNKTLAARRDINQRKRVYLAKLLGDPRQAAAPETAWGVLVKNTAAAALSLPYRPFWFMSQQYEPAQITKNLLALQESFSLLYLDDVSMR